MTATFNLGDRVRLIKTRTYWRQAPVLNSSPARIPSSEPAIGTAGVVVRLDGPRDNVVVSFEGDANFMLVTADCLEKIDTAPFEVGDRVRLTKPRSYWTAEGPVTSPNPVEGAVGSVHRVADPRGNVTVAFDGLRAFTLVRPDCLEKVGTTFEVDAGPDQTVALDDAGVATGVLGGTLVTHSHELDQDGTAVGLENARVGTYQSSDATSQDHSHTPLPPGFISVEGGRLNVQSVHKDEAGIVVSWSPADDAFQAKKQAALAEELREQAVNQLAEFKKQVAEVARRYAVEHDWCDTVEQALKELGIEPEKRRARFTLTLELNMTADLGDPDRPRETVTEEFIRTSFITQRLADQIARSLDSDFVSAQAAVSSIRVGWNPDDGWI